MTGPLGQNQSEYASAGRQLQCLQIGKMSSLQLSCELNPSMMLMVFIWNLYMVYFHKLRIFFKINTALSTTLDLYEAGHVTKSTQ